MEHVYREVGRYASRPDPVLILGETGVGKRTLASYIHDQSSRREGPFVVFDTVGLEEEAIRVELAGAGDPTSGLRPGAALQANGGTLYLSNTDELPGGTQAQLLRFIEYGEIYPPHASTPVRADARLVASASLELPDRVEAGLFRGDLFCRLGVCTIRIPPLRERTQEIPGLATAFAREIQGTEVGIAPQVFDALRRYPWPGNLLELRNTIHQAVERAECQPLRLEHLPSWVLQHP